MIMARLYRRTTRELSLVKTGSGGKKVIMDGGTIAIPFLHDISFVNMKTLRLEVARAGDASLITKDRMRVDVGVEFYVLVNATEDGFSRVAQTLGERTFHVEQLREMIEGKLIDGLRSVAARMTMDQLHENRSEFVQEVQNAISEDLLKNGLELESVALIEATKEAERLATGVRLKAAAEKDAAADRAAALLEEANADAKAITISAAAQKADMLAEAEGSRAIADSENALSEQVVAMKIALARLEAMPRIVAEMVKPAEKIESIKIHQVTGLGGNAGSGATPAGTPVNQAMDSIMGMGLQMPAPKKLGEELGISMENGLAGVVERALGGAPKPGVE